MTTKSGQGAGFKADRSADLHERVCAEIDGKPVPMTTGQVDALESFAGAVLEFFRERAPKDEKKWWTWVRVEVGDLEGSKPLTFAYGGKDDEPSDGLGRVGVVGVEG